MGALTGLTGLSGIQQLEVDSPEATPEERYGGPANPAHQNIGEQAVPYPWQSSAAMGGSHGPYGPENQMLADEMWFIEGGGMASEDPEFDYNVPSLTRSHAAMHNVTVSGAIPSQHDAINHQIDQQGNHGSDLNTSRGMQHWDEPLQDHWQEIWDVESGTELYSAIPGRVSAQAGGWGVNDHRSNEYAKVNQFGYGSGHHHRRIATGSIPGNYMWMKPGGRPMIKTLPGPARPAVGVGSPFENDDLGQAFAYDNGAILQNVPTAYVPPPNPNVATPVPVYEDPMGTDGVDLW